MDGFFIKFLNSSDGILDSRFVLNEDDIGDAIRDIVKDAIFAEGDKILVESGWCK